MVPIHGKPFLEILIENVSAHGFNRFILATGYRGDVIQEHFRYYDRVQIIFSAECEPLGTAGALKNCGGIISSDTIVVMNGDSLLSRLDYKSLLEFHERSAGIATVAVTKALERRDAGFVTFDEGGRVISFAERKWSTHSYINGGVYTFRREILERIPLGRAYSMERELLPGLAKDQFYAYLASSRCYDIGTPERLGDFVRAHSC